MRSETGVARRKTAAPGWRYGARVLRQPYRRRLYLWEKRARFAKAIPDVVDNLKRPNATALSAHRRAADQNAVL